MNEKVTGRTRVRLARERTSFGRTRDVLVLQVEVTREDGPPDSYGMPAYLKATYWRDAQVDDIDIFKLMAMA